MMLVVMASCGAMTSESKALEAARVAGFQDVTITSKSVILIGWSGCGNDDSAKFTMKGTNSNGEQVEFFVCAGPLKGATIRTN
jgi:hypothetical protein